MTAFFKKLIFLLIFLNCCSCTKSNSNLVREENTVLIVHNEKKVRISNSSPHLSIWKTVKHKDPNSTRALTYSGYQLTDLMPRILKPLKLNKIRAVKVISKDGYITRIPWNELEKAKAFLALEVSGQEKRGIYNLSLKTFFDWRPGYLIFLKDSKSLESSSPYQVVEIEIKDDDPTIKMLANVSSDLKQGAEIFIKTCNKCHSHKGLGGAKAPPISFLIERWSDDEALKSFLRNPQKTLGRKIEMSGFKGTDLDLIQLIAYLRSIEKKRSKDYQ